MSDREANTTVARLVNLAIPGGGLIMVGSEVLGVLVSILFTASASYAIAAWLLFPDDTTGAWRSLILGIAIGTYVGSQIRCAQTVRSRCEQRSAEVRRAAMRKCRIALSEGRHDEAWAALQNIAEHAETDLSVAYRIAQVQTARGEQAEARRAWRRLRELDRHRIYRAELTAAERALDECDRSDQVG